MKCEWRGGRGEEGHSSSNARTSNYSRHGGKPSLNPACIITSYNSHMHSVYSSSASSTAAAAAATAAAATAATA